MVRHVMLAQVRPEVMLFTRVGLRVAGFLAGVMELSLLFFDFLPIVKSEIKWEKFTTVAQLNTTKSVVVYY